MSLFNKVDTFLSSKVQNIKQNTHLQRIQDILAQVDDEYYFLIKWALLVFSILLPITFIAPLSSSNNELQKKIENHKKALAITDRINQINSANQRKLNEIFSSTPIDNQPDLVQQLQAIAEQHNINQELIKTSNFDIQTLEQSDISRVSIDMKFDGLTSEQTLNLFSSINLTQKGRIQETNIVKNDDGKLDGTIKIIFYTRNYQK